jgi:hypothetical protein
MTRFGTKRTALLADLCAFYYLTHGPPPILQQSSSHVDTSIRVIRDTELYAARLNARGVRGVLRGTAIAWPPHGILSFDALSMV